MTRSLIILLLMFIVACASTQNQKLPETNSWEAQLYNKICSQCHSLSHPNQHTQSEWDETVKVMLRHMKNRGVAYNIDEIQTIRDYLKRNASS